MNDAPQITAKWIKGLRWIAAREPVGWFGVDAPANYIVRRLADAKLIEACGREPGQFGPTIYRLTDAGRAVLARHPEET